MSTLNFISLVVGGVGLTLSVLMLLLVLWQNSRSLANALQGALTLASVVWFVGTLIARIGVDINAPDTLITLGARMTGIGFSTMCAALYLFSVVITGGYGRLFLRIAAACMAVVVAYQVFVSYFASGALYVQTNGELALYTFDPIWSILYGMLAITAIGVVWQQRRKIRDSQLRIGVWGLAIAILIELISPQFRANSIGLDLAVCSVLLLSYAAVRSQIVLPLSGRESQLQGFRDVGLAITSRLQLDEVLKTIATQAAEMLHADGAAIFLIRETTLELAAVHNMPERFVGHQLLLGEGLAGRVARDRRASQLEDYRRDWRGTSDMQYAREAFGAVVAVPLIFGEEVVGVLFVAEGPGGKRFDREDVRLLEMLGPQAAVAITNSRLFEKRQELDRLKNQMIRMTSHDLKNPLFAAMSRVELLQEDGVDLFTAEMNQDITTIWDQLERMKRIINGILDMERIQSGTPTYEEFPAADIIGVAVRELSGQAIEHHITLSTKLPPDLPSMIGDRHYLIQAVANLIENAVKFTASGGTIIVSAERIDDNVILHVADSGVGIPPDAQARLFERFYRVRQPGTEHVGGTGLGLSLVKAVADAHGGRIWLDSEVGAGTTFHVALPIAGPKMGDSPHRAVNAP